MGGLGGDRGSIQPEIDRLADATASSRHSQVGAIGPLAEPVRLAIELISRPGDRRHDIHSAQARLARVAAVVAIR
jgi:hypothetical protein